MGNVFVTGTNRGLGLEFTRQYLADGWKVWATHRPGASLACLMDLKQQYGDRLQLAAVELTEWANLEELASAIEEPMDVVIANAGIFGADENHWQSFNGDSWAEVIRVNVMTPLKLAQVFYPHLKRGAGKRFVALTSLMGSIEDNQSGGCYLYRSSKAALNMVCKSLSVDWQGEGLSVLALHPGWVKTDMGGAQAPLEAIESIQGMRKVITDFSLEQTGAFLDYAGRPLKW